MAVSPISNVNYINQNSQVGSVQQANAQVKLDFQTMVNLQEMQDRQEEIQEVRPTEETLKTDEDKEGNGKRDQGRDEERNLAQYRDAAWNNDGHSHIICCSAYTLFGPACV